MKTKITGCLLAVALLLAASAASADAATVAAKPAPPAAGWTAIGDLVHADDGASVLLPSGKVLWLFGDTTYIDGKVLCGQDPGTCPYGPAHDSFVLQDTDGTLTALTCGTCPFGYQQIPNQTATVNGQTVPVFLWANGGAVENGTLYVLADRIEVTGTGLFGFTTVGPSLAEFNATTLKYIKTVNFTVSGRTEVPNAAVNTSGGWRVFSTSGSSVKQGDVAYVSHGSLGSPSKWQWKFGVIPSSLASLGTALSPVYINGAWVLFTKDGDVMGSAIDRLQSTLSGGPWSVTGSWPVSPPAAGEVTYSVQVHPEQAAPAGQVLVSYAVNGGPDADYHLQFLYLPLS